MASVHTPSLFDGTSGDYAPYKAQQVNFLATAQVEEQIQNILRAQAFAQKDQLDDDLKDKISGIAKSLAKPNVAEALLAKNEGTSLQKFKICIVGAGCAGLYSAYILEFLGIDYEILEANPDRVGGRIYTHYFNGTNTGKNHQYYDVGGMRFPNSPIMNRTFDLFDRLNIGRPKKKREAGKDYRLIPYYMKGRNCPMSYNDNSSLLEGPIDNPRHIDADGKETETNMPYIRPDIPFNVGDDPFKVSTKNGGPVPESRVSHTATDEILDDAFGRFRAKIKKAEDALLQAKEFEKKAGTGKNTVESAKVEEALKQCRRAYEYLLRHDKFSLREYLQNVEGYDSQTVHWLETIDSASGWYDQAFTENVLESLAFSYGDSKTDDDEKESEDDQKKDTDTKWYCIEGGSVTMTDRLRKKIPNEKVLMGKLVTKMKLIHDEVGPGGKLGPKGVSVTFRESSRSGGSELPKEVTREYAAVINTTTLGALGKIDTSGLNLPYGMKTAIRVLRYDSSSKIGIRFKTMWWQDDRFRIDLGGVAKTDLPIRVCVYPSYNVSDPKDKPAVLLASYTWGQDSERVASHISTDSPAQDKGLKELMVNNLARLHTVRILNETEEQYEKRLEENRILIHDQWMEHHAYDWSKDEYSAGAFALFGPGQFTTLIPHLVQPASDARFVVVGEHASAHHAWVVGALDSAVRGLKQILMRFGMSEKLDAMLREFRDVEELPNETVAKQIILARLTDEEKRRIIAGLPTSVVGDVPGAGSII